MEGANQMKTVSLQDLVNIIDEKNTIIQAQAKEIERLNEYIRVADWMIDKGLKVDDLKMGDWPKQLEMQELEIND